MKHKFVRYASERIDRLLLMLLESCPADAYAWPSDNSAQVESLRPSLKKGEHSISNLLWEPFLPSRILQHQQITSTIPSPVSSLLATLVPQSPLLCPASFTVIFFFAAIRTGNGHDKWNWNLIHDCDYDYGDNYREGHTTYITHNTSFKRQSRIIHHSSNIKAQSHIIIHPALYLVLVVVVLVVVVVVFAVVVVVFTVVVAVVVFTVVVAVVVFTVVVVLVVLVNLVLLLVVVAAVVVVLLLIIIIIIF